MVWPCADTPQLMSFVEKTANNIMHSVFKRKKFFGRKFTNVLKFVTLPSDVLGHSSLPFTTRAESSCRQIRHVLLHAALAL